MNENNGRLVFLWSGADFRSILGADSQWFLRLVLTPSKAQVLTPRSYIFYFSVLSILFWLSCVSFGIRANTDLLKHHRRKEPENITHKKKEKKKPTRSTPTASKPINHQPPKPTRSTPTAPKPNSHQRRTHYHVDHRHVSCRRCLPYRRATTVVNPQPHKPIAQQPSFNLEIPLSFISFCGFFFISMYFESVSFNLESFV